MAVCNRLMMTNKNKPTTKINDGKDDEILVAETCMCEGRHVDCMNMVVRRGLMEFCVKRLNYFLFVLIFFKEY